MSFKIVITKVETRKVTKRGDYAVVDERPWTDAEIEGASRHYRNVEEFLKTKPLKEIRDYAPDWEGVETVEVKILEQNTETLDLAKVIKAVNHL